MGIGPGNAEHLTYRAERVIREAEVVVGYRTYLDLVTELLEGKEVVGSGMTQEVDRCREAIRLALEGRRVAVISSGDPGVYGMAGLVMELAAGTGLDIEIVPGLTAASAAAACLGAPLMNDFAVISLSDLMTPWTEIERRLCACAEADLVTVLYNPKSRRRTRQIAGAREIFLRKRLPTTPVGIVRNALRPGQEVIVTDLERMLDCGIDMVTTVVIGNSATRVTEGRMVTDRGYSY